jgi:hypothetical protein
MSNFASKSLESPAVRNWGQARPGETGAMAKNHPDLFISDVATLAELGAPNLTDRIAVMPINLVVE